MKRYVLGLIVAITSSAAAMLGVLFFLNPYVSGWIGLTLLLASIYFLLASLFTLIGFVIRVFRDRGEIIYAHLATAFRQGLLLSIIVVGSLLLQDFRIFNIWSAILFVAAVVLIELAFQSHSSSIELRHSQELPNTRTGQSINHGLADVRIKQLPQPHKTRFIKPDKKESHGPTTLN